MPELTKYEKNRFNQSMRCSICGKKIYNTDSFQFAKFKYGRQVAYHWFHNSCLMEVKNGEEVRKEKVN